jgi:glutamate-1-semialdehyde aminotransferase/acyl carrier protein
MTLPAQQSPMTGRSPDSSAGGNGRLSAITSKLLNVFLALSGTEIALSDADKTFFELGMDSLLLTQAASKLQSEFGVGVKFRQLVDDLSTPSSLALFLDKSLPPDAFRPSPQSAESQKPSDPSAIQQARQDTIPSDGSPHSSQGEIKMLLSFPTDAKNPLAQVIAQQLNIMSRQLEILTGKKIIAPSIESAHAPSAPLVTNVQSPEPATTPMAPIKVLPVSPGEDEAKKFVGPALRINKSHGEALSPRQQRHFKDLIERYTQRTKSSKEYTQKHRAHLADPRAVSGFRPVLKELIYPLVVNRSLGSKIWDIDGNEYVDILNGFGSNFFGHRAPFVMKAVADQLKTGIEIGPQHPLAGELADELCEFLGHDRVAFCNTGSEAVLGAMRIARTVTGRNKIVMFVGAYHGIFDEVIVRGTKTLRSIPAAPGIQPGAVDNIMVLDYGTPETLDIIRKNIHDLAAVLVEPVQSRLPELQPKEFLLELRDITEQAGTPLIFDEVVTGFRTCPGGAQEYFGIKADLATYGKVLGGGMNIGLIAGKSKYIDALDGGYWQYGDDSIPEIGVTYFAGTFVRHPPALAAAKAVVKYLKAKGPQLQKKLNAKTASLVSTLNEYFSSVSVPLQLTNFASVMRVGYTEDVPFGELLFVHLREKGVHIWDHRPSFLTIAHSDEDIAFVIDAFKQSIKEMQQGEFLPSPSNLAAAFDASKPPCPGARLGRDPEGNPAWFVPDSDRPGKYLQIGRNK